MDLQVTFRGLCLFVPDPGGTRLHVLMPGTAHGGHGSHVAQHAVTLEYAGAKTLKMDGWCMELTKLKGNGKLLVPPDYAIDVGKLLNRQVDKKQVSLHPLASVAARFTLPAVSEFTPGETAQWDIEHEDGTPGGTVTLTHELTCRIEKVDANGFTWLRQRLRDAAGTTETLPPPEATGDTLFLTVQHLPPDPSDDPDLNPGDEARHFRAYFAVFGGNGAGPKLKLKSKPLIPPSAKDKDGGTPYNCMVAEGPLRP